MINNKNMYCISYRALIISHKTQRMVKPQSHIHELTHDHLRPSNLVNTVKLGVANLYLPSGHNHSRNNYDFQKSSRLLCHFMSSFILTYTNDNVTFVQEYITISRITQNLSKIQHNCTTNRKDRNKFTHDLKFYA